MQTTINLDADTLAKLGITIDQLQQAASDALGSLTHPVTGETLYFNDVRVTVIADCPEINIWTAGHAAGTTSLNQAGIELHADKPSQTSAYATNAGQPFVQFDVTQAAITEQQMRDRIKLLASEMDANDEENRDMQAEIDALYAKIDAAQDATA